MQPATTDDPRTDDLRVVPAQEAPFADIEAVFGTKGDPAHCWCQWYKIPGSNWRSVGDDALRGRLEAQLATSDTGPGLLAYDGDTPVGWCAVEPRANLVRLPHSRIVAGGTPDPDFDDPGIWAVSCFVVPRAYRKRGVGGALAGAAVAGKDDRLIGALIGGALGAGGGYLIGMQVGNKNDKDDAEKKDDAIKSSQQAETNPATAQQAKNAKTADINDDGFVTLDEVAALEAAGLKDKDIIHKLQITQQVFELTPQQEQYLREHNVTDTVIEAMRGMNRASEGSGQLASDKMSGSERISKKGQ